MAETVDLQARVNELRRRAAQARDTAALQTLLDETRSVVQAAFQTEVEADSRELFRNLRDQLKDASRIGGSTKFERLRARLLAEQTRLRSGTRADVPQVVNALAEVLRELTASSRDTELRRTTLDLIGQAAAHSSEMCARVLAILAEPDIAALPGVKTAVNQLQAQFAAQRSGAQQLATRLDERVAQSRRLFYAGDYLEAADLLHDILNHDPEHTEARERLAQVEDYLRRGVVPDSRVPFEARAAFGRGQSLERAGRFEEARVAYHKSLVAARDGGPLLQNWQPAVEAAMRVDNSLIAREMRDEADRLLKADDWSAAVEQYQAVLRLLPDDDRAAERLQLIQTVQNKLTSVLTANGDLTQRSQDAAEVLAAARDLQRIAPGSKRPEMVRQELAPVVAPLRDDLVVRSNDLVEQSGLLSNIGDRRRLLQQAIGLLETVQQLAPGADLASRTQAVRFRLNALDQVDESLDEIERLLQLNTVSARRQAAELLRDLWGYSQDVRYLRNLRALQQQHVERTRAAMQARTWPVAEGEIAAARAEIFNILDHDEEVLKLERQFRRARRAPWIRLTVMGGLLAAAIVAALLFGIPARQYISNLAAPPTAVAPTTAPATALPTAAPAATEAPTEAPTVEPTSAPSATLLPTSTSPPTASPSPAPTSTGVPRYGAVNSESAARLSPDALAPWAFTLRLADPVQVLAEVYDVDGRLWYKIRYVRGDSELVGWAQARDINVSP